MGRSSALKLPPCRVVVCGRTVPAWSDGLCGVLHSQERGETAAFHAEKGCRATFAPRYRASGFFSEYGENRQRFRSKFSRTDTALPSDNSQNRQAPRAAQEWLLSSRLILEGLQDFGLSLVGTVLTACHHVASLNLMYYKSHFFAIYVNMLSEKI